MSKSEENKILDLFIDFCIAAYLLGWLKILWEFIIPTLFPFIYGNIIFAMQILVEFYKIIQDEIPWFVFFIPFFVKLVNDHKEKEEEQIIKIFRNRIKKAYLDIFEMIKSKTVGLS